MKFLIWPEKKDLFGGKTSSDFLFFTGELLSAYPRGVTLLLSGRMLLTEI
jgi:hypothetical protein